MDALNKESVFQRLSDRETIDKWDMLRPKLDRLFSYPQEHFDSLEYDTTRQSLLNFFAKHLCAAEFHWFFIQGIDAILNRLYIPGVSSLLNGIEASLRITLAQVESGDFANISPYCVLSNKLIRDARVIGMPISVLAFPTEANFDQNLESKKPDLVNVEIVRYRNDICHGNILEFIDHGFGEQNLIFTPDCISSLAFLLIDISGIWAEQLGQFRRGHNFSHYDP